MAAHEVGHGPVPMAGVPLGGEDPLVHLKVAAREAPEGLDQALGGGARDRAPSQLDGGDGPRVDHGVERGAGRRMQRDAVELVAGRLDTDGAMHLALAKRIQREAYVNGFDSDCSVNGTRVSPTS